MLVQICGITAGPVSAEVVAEDVPGMLREGRAFAKLAPNIVVKVPMSEEGLEAISAFADEGIKTNCTLIFSANQGLLAAKAGASLLSPFVGRLDDLNQDGMDVIRELVSIVEIARSGDRGADGVASGARVTSPTPRSPADTWPRCHSRCSSRWSTTRSRTRASSSSRRTGPRHARRLPPNPEQPSV